jgi:hypothetical protein
MASPSQVVDRPFDRLHSVFLLSTIMMQPAQANNDEAFEEENIGLDEQPNMIEQGAAPTEDEEIVEYNSLGDPVIIPPKDDLAERYTQNMQYEQYGEAIVNAKMMVARDIKAGRDRTNSLILLGDAQSLNGEHLPATSNYIDALEQRMESAEYGRLDKSLIEPYERLGKAYLACVLNVVKLDREIKEMISEEMKRLEQENPDMKDGELLDLARDNLKPQIKAHKESYNLEIKNLNPKNKEDEQVMCADIHALHALGRASHVAEVNEGPNTPLKNDIFRTQIDIQVLKANMLMELGLSEDVLGGILKEMRRADGIAENLYYNNEKAIRAEHGTEEHIDLLPFINERGTWYLRSLRAVDATKEFQKGKELIQSLRNAEINALIADEVASLSSNMDEEEAIGVAKEKFAEEIAEIEAKYFEYEVEQLDLITAGTHGDNDIGDILTKQQDANMGFGNENQIPGLSPSTPDRTKTHARKQMLEGERALEEKAITLEEADAEPYEIAKAYVFAADQLLRNNRGAGRADEMYHKAWQVLKEANDKEGFDRLLRVPIILNYQQPANLISRLRNGMEGYEFKGPIGRKQDGFYTVSYVFNVAANGKLKNLEVEDNLTGASEGADWEGHGSSVERTQRIALMYLGVKARPSRSWETGEVNDQKVRFVRRWGGEYFNVPAQMTDELGEAAPLPYNHP